MNLLSTITKAENSCNIDLADEKYDTEQNDNKKYILDGLVIEITRKCNMDCDFCMKGNPQDLSISKETIDGIFENIYDVKELVLTGGEPLLAVDEIEYFCKKLINSNWNTEFLLIVTNGTIKSKKFVECITNLVQSKHIGVQLSFSVDDFHKGNQLQLNSMEYYIDEFTNNKVFSSEKVDYNKVVCGIRDGRDKENQEKNIVYLGKAKNYIKNHIDRLLQNNQLQNQMLYINGYLPILACSSMGFKYGHKLTVNNNKVMCFVTVSYQGDVLPLSDYDYETMDKEKIGNINKDSIEKIIDKYNDSVFFQCYEEGNLRKILSALKFRPFSKAMQSYLSLIAKSYFITFILRKLIHINFPEIQSSTILNHLKIPTENEWVKILVDLYAKIYGETVYISPVWAEQREIQKLLDMLEDESIDYNGNNSMYLNKSAEELFYNSDLLHHFDIKI